MLKIRIAGTEGELRQIAHKVGTTNIKRFKRDNGKTTFAIDVQISVKDFLDNLDLNANMDSDTYIHSSSNDNKLSYCNPQEIQADLEDLLQQFNDK
ncbi:MAG: hypothetical protein QNL62_00055 [Gammaproteobacteria bacterium]|nr:hypothetical protein [Gammaproteobacteria bacterium]